MPSVMDIPPNVLDLPVGPLARCTPGDAHYRVWELLESVVDPELPVVNLRDMGVLRAVRDTPQGLEVVLTPTYSACPALGQMVDDVATALARAKVAARVSVSIAPAWSTDWMTPQAHEQLRAFGIAPPRACASAQSGPSVLRFAPTLAAAVACPRCGSPQTTCVSAFGSTACKALYRCLDCVEPFDYFKPF